MICSPSCFVDEIFSKTTAFSQTGSSFLPRSSLLLTAPSTGIGELFTRIQIQESRRYTECTEYNVRVAMESRTDISWDRPKRMNTSSEKKSFGSNELSLNAPGARSYPVSPPGLSNRYRSHCPVFIVLIFIVISCGQIQGHVAAAFLVIFPEIPLDDVVYTSDSTSSASRFDTH